uniref:Uncharacterized protein n=1 Tax=Oryza punctata TaxID=4537 RepID=A0A0E0MEL9_ORYPU
MEVYQKVLSKHGRSTEQGELHGTRTELQSNFRLESNPLKAQFPSCDEREIEAPVVMVTVDPRTSDASNSKGCLAFDVSNVLVEPDIHDIFARIPGYGFVHTFYTQIPDLLQWKSTARKLFDVLNEVVVDRGSNPYLSKIECYEHNHLITKIPDGARSNAWVSFDGKRRQQLSRGYSVQISMSQLPLPNVNESDQTGDFHSLIRCLNWKERLDQKTLYRLVLPCTCIALHIDTPFNRCHAQQWLINIQLHDY